MANAAAIEHPSLVSMMMAALCVRVDADGNHLENFSFGGPERTRHTRLADDSCMIALVATMMVRGSCA